MSELSVAVDRATRTVAARGEVDLFERSRFADMLGAAYAAGTRRIDLTELTCIGGPGAAVLFDLADRFDLTLLIEFGAWWARSCTRWGSIGPPCCALCPGVARPGRPPAVDPRGSPTYGRSTCVRRPPRVRRLRCSPGWCSGCRFGPVRPARRRAVATDPVRFPADPETDDHGRRP